MLKAKYDWPPASDSSDFALLAEKNPNSAMLASLCRFVSRSMKVRRRAANDQRMTLYQSQTLEIVSEQVTNI